MRKVLLILYLIIMYSAMAKAQMHNVWVLPNGGIDFNITPPMPINTVNYNINSVNSSICDSTGKLQLYTIDDEIYNADYKRIGTLETQYSNSLNISCVLFLPKPGSSTQYYLFHIDNSDYYHGSHLYYSIIDIAGNSGKGEVTVKNQELFKAKMNWVTAVKQENQKDYWLVMYAQTDTFYAFPITVAGIGNKIQSVANNIKTPTNLLAGLSTLRASFDGKLLVNTFNIAIRNKQNMYIYDEYYSHACAYNFDNKTGVVSNKQVLLENHLLNINIGDTAIRDFGDATFSPNDSMIYICNGSGYKSTNLFQVERFAANPVKTVIVIPYPFVISSVQTAPDGHTYILSQRNFDIIKFPDKKGKACKIITEYVKSKAGGYKFPSIFLEIHRLGFLTQSCTSKFYLTTQTDTGYFKTFTWFFPNGDSLSGKSVKYTFGGKSGKYLVKLRGTSKYGAINWYSDTVIYTAPPKAFFTAESKTGCQWVGYQFTNQSFADTIHPVLGEHKIWNFGDGTTDTARNPLHIFNNPGTYTVSLIYSNGFCSDTFIQAQKVEILPAPKPGFTVSDTLSCIPFTIQVKDISQGEVIKYTYTFGKEFQSNDANASYTFTKPGIYYITQKLLGPTGCITSDFVRVRAREGILPNDKAEMMRASFVNNTQVEVSWRKHPLAAYYTLYKQYAKNSYVALQKHFLDTVYMDNIASLDKQAFNYYVTATDSCGNTSAPSLIAQPVVLTGENSNNEVFFLNWTEYEQWQNGVADYTLQYEIINDSFSNISSTNLLAANDSLRTLSRNFAQCYRIAATELNGNKQVSYSNVVCLPHIPMVYIPNAFSPNNDFINDTFKISTLGITGSKISIYNRWGEKVYENNTGEAINWDGKFRSAFVPADIYTYTLQIRTAERKNLYKTGIINLIR